MKTRLHHATNAKCGGAVVTEAAARVAEPQGNLVSLPASHGCTPAVALRAHTRINYRTPRNDARAIFGLAED